LNAATKGTLDTLTSGHKDLIEEQVRIRSEFGNVNKELSTKISENMVALDFEKRIIKEAEQQLSSMAEAIATTLGKRGWSCLYIRCTLSHFSPSFFVSRKHDCRIAGTGRETKGGACGGS
jgi:phosphopantetheine adenylyltransferase